MSSENYLKKELYDLVQEKPDVFDFLQEGSLDGLWYWDLEKPENEWMSESFWRTFGFDPKTKKHLASEWQDLIFPEDLELAVDNFKKHCDDPNHPYDQVVRYKHSDGSVVWVRCRGMAIRDEDGKPIRMLGAHTDITDLKQSEEKLNVFKKAVDFSTDSVVMANLDNKIVYANKSFEDLFKYSEAEALEMSFDDLVDDSSSSSLVADMRREATAGKVFKSDQLFFKKSNGEVLQVDISFYPVIDGGDVQFFVALMSDITEKKRVEKAKTEFVSLASHQLRTPLSIINWYTETLIEDYNDGLTEEQKDFLQEIYDAKDRMSDLIGALLNLSRLEMGRLPVCPKKSNYVKIAERILKELTPRLRSKKLNLKTEFDPLPDLMIDEDLVGIIFDNLLTNAIKYNSDGGTLTIKLKRANGDVVMTVSDTGVGVPAEQRDKVFEKMYRAENVRDGMVGGNGLGLYLTKSVLDSIGGKIWFESEAGVGSSFYVKLKLEDMEPVDPLSESK